MTPLRPMVSIASALNALGKIVIILFILSFSSVAYAKPCSKINYIIGESIAWMMQRNIDCEVNHFYQDAEAQRTPSMVLNAIVRAKQAHPRMFDGKNVILSSGASNDPGRNQDMPTITQLNKIESQLQELKTANHIYLLGVGRGINSNLERMKYNQALEKLSEKFHNVIFMGALITGRDLVHPKPRPHKDFQELYNKAEAYHE